MPALLLILVMALALGCSASPQVPSQAPRAVSTPDATTAASPAAEPTTPLLGSDRVLPAGTYLIDYLPQAHITVTIPAGWEAFQGWAILKNGIDPPTGMGLGFKLADNVYANSCHWRDALFDPPVGPSVDDLVAAFTLQPDRKPTTPIDITVDGYHGRSVDFTVPDLDLATCDEGQYRSYTTMNWDGTDHGARFHQGPGQTDRNWILDVEGHRLVINGAFFLDTSAADRAELQAMMGSIRIDP